MEYRHRVGSEEAVRSLYRRVIDGWNAKDAGAISAPVAADGLFIGFDGSQMHGRDQVAAELGRVFSDHEPASYVTIVRSVKALGPDTAILHAVAGMVPPDGSEIMPDRNTIQVLLGSRDENGWSAALFQNTPASFDGRPELSEALTMELSKLL